MAPQRHRYTKCILFTGQRSNKSNERVVCKYCSEGESPQWALQYASLCNTKKLVKSHLRRCRFFQAAQAVAADESLVFTEDEDSDAEDAEAKELRKNAKTYLFVAADSTNANATNSANTNDTTAPTVGNSTTTTDQPATKRTKTNGDGRRTTKRNAQVAEGIVHDQETLERLLLNATLANDWSFSWIKNRASAQLLQYLNPQVQIPSPEALSQRVLDVAGEKEAKYTTSAVERERIGCTLVVDSWNHVVDAKSLGVLLTTSQGEVLVWDMVNGVNTDEPSVVASVVNEQVASAETASVPLVGVVADSSEAFARVRKELRRSRRDLIVVPCITHQLHAFAADLFDLVPTFKSTMEGAIELSTVVRRSSVLQTRVRQQQRIMGASPSSIANALPAKMDWDALRSVTASVLAMKDPLQAIVVCTDDDTDEELRNAAAADELPQELAELVRPPSKFWDTLADLDHLIGAVAGWITTLGSGQGRLHYVPRITQSLTSTIQALDNTEIEPALLKRVEDRWNEWEHPLLILAVVLNPALGWATIDKTSGVTLMRIGCWARYYFESFFGMQPNNLSNELLEFIEGDKFWCSTASIGSFTTPVPRNSKPKQESTTGASDSEVLAALSFKTIQYWKSCNSDCPELSKLALSIFSVVLTTASTDGLFDDVPAMLETDQASGHRQKIAAIRVRARATCEQLQDAATPRAAVSAVVQDIVVPSNEFTEASSSVNQTAVNDRVKFESWVNHWKNQPIENTAADIERDSDNENEAINSMYAKIHPTDDKFSKYPVQHLLTTSLSPLASTTATTTVAPDAATANDETENEI